jgi:hypothetical protein
MQGSGQMTVRIPSSLFHFSVAGHQCQWLRRVPNSVHRPLIVQSRGPLPGEDSTKLPRPPKPDPPKEPKPDPSKDKKT